MGFNLNTSYTSTLKFWFFSTGGGFAGGAYSKSQSILSSEVKGKQNRWC